MDLTHASIRAKWINDPEVRLMLNSPYPVSDTSTRDWVHKLITDPSKIDFIIYLKAKNLPIGYVGFRDIDLKNRKAEHYTGIGEKDYWRKGLASEAKLTALNYLFQTYDLNKVYVKIRTDNPAALDLNKKLGFLVDGVMRKEIYSHGAHRDLTILSILREEFYQAHCSVGAH